MRHNMKNKTERELINILIANEDRPQVLAAKAERGNRYRLVEALERMGVVFPSSGIAGDILAEALAKHPRP